ncbi:MAG: hypothetical protein QXL31_07535 [Thermosphaera sp.]
MAILIGILVVIVAGILISQLYFGYSASLSHRPAAIIEYVDVVRGGSVATLVINIKNAGNVPITGIRIAGGGVSIEKTGLTISPGMVYGLAENIPNPLSNRILSVTVIFQDGSTQSYTISLGPLGPRISEGGGGGEEEPEEEEGPRAFSIGVSERILEIKVAGSGSINIILASEGYEGWLSVSAACPDALLCELSADRVYLGKNDEVTVRLTVTGLSEGTYGVEIMVIDERSGQSSEAYLSVIVGDFHLSLDPGVLELIPGQTGISNLMITSANYLGRLKILVTDCPWQGSCWVSPDEVELEKNGVSSAQVGVGVPGGAPAGEYTVGIRVEDVETGHGKSLELRIKVQYFTLDVLEDRVKGFVGGRASATIELRSAGGYSGCITLSYSAEPWDGISDAEFDQNPVCLDAGDVKRAIFSFKISRAVDTMITVTGTDDEEVSASDAFTVMGMDFDAYFSPSDITIPVGGQGSSNLIVVSRNYEGIMDFEIVECPSQLTCMISSTSVQLPKNGQASTQLTIRAGNTGGTFTVRVEARDRETGYSKHAPLTVTVSDFSISLSPSRVTISRGSSGTVTVTISSIAGYSGTIRLEAVNAPDGTEFSFNPNPVGVPQGGSATSALTISVRSDAEPGTYTVWVRGTDQNGVSREAPLTLTILVESIEPPPWPPGPPWPPWPPPIPY